MCMMLPFEESNSARGVLSEQRARKESATRPSVLMELQNRCLSVVSWHVPFKSCVSSHRSIRGVDQALWLGLHLNSSVEHFRSSEVLHQRRQCQKNWEMAGEPGSARLEILVGSTEQSRSQSHCARYSALSSMASKLQL